MFVAIDLFLGWLCCFRFCVLDLGCAWNLGWICHDFCVLLCSCGFGLIWCGFVASDCCLGFGVACGYGFLDLGVSVELVWSWQLESLIGFVVVIVVVFFNFIGGMVYICLCYFGLGMAFDVVDSVFVFCVVFLCFLILTFALR